MHVCLSDRVVLLLLRGPDDNITSAPGPYEHPTTLLVPKKVASALREKCLHLSSCFYTCAAKTRPTRAAHHNMPNCLVRTNSTCFVCRSQNVLPKYYRFEAVGDHNFHGILTRAPTRMKKNRQHVCGEYKPSDTMLLDIVSNGQ